MDADLPASTPNEASKGASSDKRAFRRYHVSMAVLARAVPEDETARTERQNARRDPTVSVVVSDLSLSGLVFVAPRPFPTGSLVEIQFSLGAYVYPVRAVVKRCQGIDLPGRRAFRCAAQLVRGEGASRFIPVMARYLVKRFGSAGVSK